MKAILNRLIQQDTLNKEEAKSILVNISKGEYNSSQIASFLTIFMMRTITIDELSGFKDALLELCIPVPIKEYGAIDLCGTGGDGKDTFNISTLASFITAGAGVHVAKHGNYGVSSSCGSSNVMEFLGIKFTNDINFHKKALDLANICVLHAPLFHPAMKHVAPIRRELGVKTFFNMLGPMVNPSFPKYQMVGVFNLELLRLYSYLYQKTDKKYTIVHALDGYDEISLTGPAKIINNSSELMFKPEDLKLKILKQSEIYGGDSVKSAAKIFTNILNGDGTPAQNSVACTNAALAIATVRDIDIASAYDLAKESLESGQAKHVFKILVNLSAEA